MTANDTSYFISEPSTGYKSLSGGKNTFEFLKITDKNIKYNYLISEITNRLEDTKNKSK